MGRVGKPGPPVCVFITPDWHEAGHPTMNAMSIGVTPSVLNKKITVIFQGGKGQSATQRVDVVDTHDDGTVETKSIVRPESGSILAGSSVTFTGTLTDRIEVTVWLNGVSYKIYDKVLPLASRS